MYDDSNAEGLSNWMVFQTKLGFGGNIKEIEDFYITLNCWY